MVEWLEPGLSIGVGKSQGISNRVAPAIADAKF